MTAVDNLFNSVVKGVEQRVGGETPMADPIVVQHRNSFRHQRVLGPGFRKLTWLFVVAVRGASVTCTLAIAASSLNNTFASLGEVESLIIVCQVSTFECSVFSNVSDARFTSQLQS